MLVRTWIGFCAALLLGTVAHAEEKIWHVKAIHPDGKLLDVKAIDARGKIFPVKVLQTGDVHLMDVKALVENARLPVKLVASGDKPPVLAAIAADGKLLPIYALTAEGQKLEVRGVKHTGNIIHVKAIGPKGEHFGVKAIAPEGWVFDVKGVKVSPERIEGKVNGVEIEAHVKAMPQAPESWN
jgi:hypothetical protein